MTQPRALLISRVGPRSLHRHWLGDLHAPRDFDVLLSAYDPAVIAPDGEGILFEHRPGAKVAGYGALLRAHRALLARYDYVALFDDDLLIESADLARLFAIVRYYRPRIAQPALTPESYFTYAALLRHPGFLLWHISYIEMMCPIFRADVLERLIPLFELGHESGIDIIWSNLVWENPQDLAVIDAVPVVHTQRVGGRKADNGFVDGRRYEDDIAAILACFGAQWLPCLPYGGIRAGGQVVKGRGGMMPAALGLVRTVPLQRPMKMRARNLAVYWKHMLTARARNMALDWPPAS
jgi:hypothetical protein